MDFTRTRGVDWLAALAGAVALVALFVPFYDADGIGVSGWEALGVIDVVLAVFALSAISLPFVTAARDATPVPLVVNVLTVTFGVVAVLLIAIRVIWVPSLDVTVLGFGGDARTIEATRQWGLWVALAATLATTYGLYRALRDDRAPGVVPAPGPVRMPAPRGS